MSTQPDLTELTQAEREELARLRKVEARLQRRLTDLARRHAELPDGPRTLNEIADRLGVSKSRVHQIQRIALMKLRHNTDLKDLLRP